MSKAKSPTEKQFVFTSKNIEEIIYKQSQGFSLPRFMNPWFKNQVGVRKQGVTFGWTDTELREFIRCKDDIHYFANTYCKIKSEDGQVKQMQLRDYQYDVLTAYTKNRFTINMSSRQTGKCVHGDTKICVSSLNGQSYKIMSIRELFEKYNGYLKNTDVPDYDDNILNKVFHTIDLDRHNLSVLTATGWTKIHEINLTRKMQTYKMQFMGGETIKCADIHLLFTEDGWLPAADLQIGQKVMTGKGFTTLVLKHIDETMTPLFDLTTESGDYYSAGNADDNMSPQDFIDVAVLSHNTITAAITLLHYSIFNKNKGLMVVANKSDTVVEILDKIKNIYKLLPFFLKPGLVNWNSKSIVFENGCRIKSQARSKEPAIGFTIDFLYMDEFAHIPPNIINHYYKAAVPTVSSITGSKIVITSTPNGANLFKELVMNALLPDGDPNKNMYKLIKVLWWQVPNGSFTVNGEKINGTRMDPKLYPDHAMLREMGLTMNSLLAELQKMKFICKIDEEMTDAGPKYFIKILHKPGVSDMETIRELRIFNMNVTKLCMVSNWQEEEEKLIGGAENFNQEYNIQFIAGAKRVLSAPKAAELEKRQINYVYHNVPELEHLEFGYDELKWAPDFVPENRNKYYWFGSIDLSEGLGQDYSVINLFRLMLRPKEWFEENKIAALSDAFYLKQTGIYQSNVLSPAHEIPEIFYSLMFDYLKPERVKNVLEINGPGPTFLASLPNVYNQNNLFAKYVFVKYYHRADDTVKKIGLKVNRNKKMLVKNYITSIENDRLYVDEKGTLEQMDNFIKVETRGGDFTYKADSGNDDVVMTLVNGATIFDTQDFKNVCQMYYEELTPENKKTIDDALNANAVNYNTMTYSSIYNNGGGFRKNRNSK